MITAHADTFEDRTDVNSLDVRFRGRLIPDRPRKAAAAERVPNIIGEQANSTFSRRLSDSLWPKLPFVAQVACVPSDRTALVKAYVESLNQLQALQRDFVHLLTVTCEANLDFRQETGTTNQATRDKSMRATLDKMVARSKASIKPIENILTAEVAASPVEQMQRKLTAALIRAVNQFAWQVQEALQNMAAKRLAGLVEWVGQNACRYHFFKEVVIQENDGFKSSTKRTSRPITDRHGYQHQQVVEKTTTGESGRTIHRWARHEHHVMNAFHTSLANTKVRMTPGAQQIAQAIPGWLEPFVRVIDGDLIRERIIECDYHKEQWSDTTTRVVDLPVYGLEPAITVDSFVLTGWGPREISAEERRCESLQKIVGDKSVAASSGRECSLWVSAAAASAFLSSLFVTELDSSPVVGVFALMLSIYAAMNAVRSHERATGVRSAGLNYVSAAVITLGFLFAGGLFSLGLQLNSLKDVLLGVLLLVLSSLGLYSILVLWKHQADRKP